MKNYTIILISLDAYGWEYFQNNTLQDVRENLDRLATGGVSSEMLPIFPSVTFPNHYTMVTGLYAESHGIIENQMYDPVLNESFSIFDSSVNDPVWYLGEPIWETMEQYSLKRCDQIVFFYFFYLV